MNTPSSVAPISGRLCKRKLDAGQALVGVLTLDKMFTPVPGVAYLMFEYDGGIGLATEPLDKGLDKYHQHSGIASLMIDKIWHRTTHPAGIVVRFLEAFPDENIWTVYGVSSHKAPNDQPTHAWLEVKGDKTNKIPPPYDARGDSIDQMLNSHAIWPGPSGKLYSLPTITPLLRQTLFDYHKLLAMAARDERVNDTLEAIIRSDPRFCELNASEVNREFCEYIRQKDDAGLLAIDKPHTEEELQAHHEFTNSVVRELMSAEDESEKVKRLIKKLKS